MVKGFFFQMGLLFWVMTIISSLWINLETNCDWFVMSMSFIYTLLFYTKFYHKGVLIISVYLCFYPYHWYPFFVPVSHPLLLFWDLLGARWSWTILVGIHYSFQLPILTWSNVLEFSHIIISTGIHVSTEASLGFVASSLTIGVLLSLLANKSD